MICLSEQNLIHLYNLFKKEGTHGIFYLENHDWVTASYLQARYEAYIDEDILYRHLHDHLFITSDHSTLLHALMFTKRDITNDEQLLSLANRKDTCERTSIYYAQQENHIMALLPFVIDNEQMEDIANYKMKKGNYVALDQFITTNGSNFNKILDYACDKNLTQLLLKLIPKCFSNDQKYKIYFTLGMQYPVLSHPLSRMWFAKCPPTDLYFMDRIKNHYSNENKKFFNILRWILDFVKERSEEMVTLILHCYYELLIAIYQRTTLDSKHIRTSMLLRTPFCAKQMCDYFDDPELVADLCRMLQSHESFYFFGSDYVYVIAWWFFVMKCKPPHNKESIDIINSALRYFLSSRVNSRSKNTLLHMICLHPFSFNGYNNNDFLQWAKEIADLETLQKENNLGFTVYDLASVSPYISQF